jgi:hypothetical protein
MNRQEQIDDIMDHFDFEKVHKAMVALEWVWHNSSTGRSEVPERWEIRKRARTLLHNAMDVAEKASRPMKGGWIVGTGGFIAVSNKNEAPTPEAWEEHPITLHLSFQVSNWSNSSNGY